MSLSPSEAQAYIRSLVSAFGPSTTHDSKEITSRNQTHNDDDGDIDEDNAELYVPQPLSLFESCPSPPLPHFNHDLSTFKSLPSFPTLPVTPTRDSHVVEMEQKLRYYEKLLQKREHELSVLQQEHYILQFQHNTICTHHSSMKK